MKSFFFLIIFSFLLYGVPLETKLLDENSTKIYPVYLSTLEKVKDEDNATIQLQKSLLARLIELTGKSEKNSVALLASGNIKNSQEYLQAFYVYVENFAERKSIKNELKQKEEKISYLKNQIFASDENESIENNNTLPSVVQLQYAFYVKSQEKLQERQEKLREAQEKNLNVLLQTIERIAFDAKSTKDSTEEKNKKLKDLYLEREGLEIEKERFGLLGDTKGIDRFEKKIKKVSEEINAIAEMFIRKSLNYFFAALKEKDQNVFVVKEEVKNYIASMTPGKQRSYANMLDAMDKLISERIGATKVLATQTKEGFALLGKDILEKLHYPLFSVNKKQISTLDLLLALFIFVFGLFLASLYRRYIKRIGQKVKNLSLSSQVILSNIGSYFIIIVSFFVMLKTIGLDLSSFTVIAGALSVGIGFGLQNIIANFISGIILFFEKSIKIGDFLQISDTLRGRVSDIRMRSIIIRTNDNIDVIVPNQTFIQEQVINWTLSDDIRRMHVPFGIAYGSDIEKVKTVILNALEKSEIEYIRYDKEKQPQVVMKAMSGSSVDFELWVWVHGDNAAKPSGTMDCFLVLLYNTLYENHIEIPFPQLDVHVRRIKEKSEIINKED
ncbi:MAG: potassium-dependent mechanosensitive channel [Campylobacterota bacterium]|nr:potassium-dependent mechanosensitive channel [Campylobacterota bacterium]